MPYYFKYAVYTVVIMLPIIIFVMMLILET